MAYSGSDLALRAGAPWLRPSLIAQLAAFAALSAAYFAWTWSTVLGDFGGDNAVYLFMAQYYSPWGEHSELAATFARRSQYPPLYPFILGLFDAGRNVLVAHIVTTGFLLLAFAALYFWLRTLDFTALVASVATLLFALLPGTYFQVLSILSENLYLLLSLICLAATVRAETNGDERWLWVAAIAVAGATLTRSAGISLLAAFLAYLVFNRRADRWGLMLVAAASMVLWSLVSGQLQRGYLSSLANNYGSDLLSALAGQAYVGARMLWYGWCSNFTTSPVGLPVMAVVGVISLAGMAMRLYRHKLDGFYTLFYLLMIMAWPFPVEAQRLLFVISPVLIVQGLVLMRNLARRNNDRRKLDFALLLYVPAIGLAVLPTLVLSIERYLRPVPEPYAEYKHIADWYGVAAPNRALDRIAFLALYIESLKGIPEVIPEKECVYSILPAIAAFYANRRSVSPPPEAVGNPDFHESLKKSGCRFFHLAGFVTPTFGTPYYPAERLRDSLRVLRSTYLPARADNPVALLAEVVDGDSSRVTPASASGVHLRFVSPSPTQEEQ